MYGPLKGLPILLEGFLKVLFPGLVPLIVVFPIWILVTEYGTPGIPWRRSLLKAVSVSCCEFSNGAMYPSIIETPLISVTDAIVIIDESL